MSLDELTETHRPDIARGEACVVIAAHAGDPAAHRCVESLAAHTASEVLVTRVDPTSAAVSRALELLAPADVVLLGEPCLVSAGWLEALRDAAYGDTTTATASALSSAGTALALDNLGVAEVGLDTLASD